jgi:RNA polymerase sigma factor (sigma-70 family)
VSPLCHGAEPDDRQSELWQAIDALPEKLRMVVILAGIEEHNLHHVAELLGVPEGTVKSRLFAARQRLRELRTALRRPGVGHGPEE